MNVPHYTRSMARLVRGRTIVKFMSSHAIASKSSLRPKITLPAIHNMYKEGKPIAMLTAYDFPTGRLCETTSVDITLVGDSLAQVCLGYDSPIQLTLDEMIHHCRAVGRGSKSPFFMADMPFGTYCTPEDALRNAVRLIREGGVEAVKIEGGLEVVETVKKLTDFGIPVMGHIGLMPQRSSSIGGFIVQGRSGKSASVILDAALRLQDAGVFALLLEAVPGVVGKHIAENVRNVPIIGIGAGSAVGGQVLVVNDALGISPKTPKFVRRFAEFGESAQTAIESYVAAVKSRDFPSKEESYLMPRDQFQSLRSQAIPHSPAENPTEPPESHTKASTTVEASTAKPATGNLLAQAILGEDTIHEPPVHAS